MKTEPRRRGEARDRILDLAETAILEKGFGATSIEELVTGAGITKSGFFYHFKDKTELARAILQRYIAREEALFDGLFTRALHGFLVGLKMLAELMADLPAGHPGCVVASFCYQERLFDAEVCELNRRAVLAWRARFRHQLERIAERYPPRIDVSLDDLADMLSVIADGGIILSKVLRDKAALPRQVLLYREFVRSVFAPPL